MKAFQFRLESLLYLHELKKEKALEVLAMSIKQRDRAKSDWADNRNYIEQIAQQIREESGSWTAAQWAAFQSVLSLKREQGKCLEEKLLEFIDAEKRALQNYLKAKFEFDRMQKLKTKKKEAYQFECVKKEEKEVEELCSRKVA